MDELKVETSDLRSSADALVVIADAFDDAASQSGALAAAVGHDGLAQRVTDFAKRWDARRGELTEQIRTLEQNLRDSADAIDNADRALAKQLDDHREQARAARPTGPRSTWAAIRCPATRP